MPSEGDRCQPWDSEARSTRSDATTARLHSSPSRIARTALFCLVSQIPPLRQTSSVSCGQPSIYFDWATFLLLPRFSNTSLLLDLVGQQGEQSRRPMAALVTFHFLHRSRRRFSRWRNGRLKGDISRPLCVTQSCPRAHYRTRMK
jgi:hypothetical protein